MPIRSLLQVRRLRRFAGDSEGATAVEFALIATVFVPVLCAIIETALVFWAGQVLDTSLANATRGLYTGTFQNSNQQTTKDGKTTPSNEDVLGKLRNLMCYPNGDNTKPALTTIFTCSDVQLDVRKAEDFKDGTFDSPIDPKTGTYKEGFGTNYAAPPSGKIAIVQAAVKFPSFFAFLKPSQAAFSDGSVLLRSTVAFRTEPY